MHSKISKKIIISAFSLLIGASVAGSVTSTIAWYQYATRALVAYTGNTSHCSKLLRISTDKTHWDTNLGSSDLPNVSFAPITTGEQLKNAALPNDFYMQPNLRQGAYANWRKASSSSEDLYAQFDLYVKVNDVNATSPQLANDVYLTDVTIQDASTNGSLDLSNAIRVHIATTYTENSATAHKYFLFAKSATSTDVGGYLDVDSDGAYDTVTGYEWDTEKVIYGAATDNGNGTITPAVQTSYLYNDNTIIAASDSKGELSGGTSIGKTSATANEYLKVTVTIWLEGWALLHTGVDTNIDSTDTQIWDSATYVDKSFNVGVTFGVKLHSDAE